MKRAGHSVSGMVTINLLLIGKMMVKKLGTLEKRKAESDHIIII